MFVTFAISLLVVVAPRRVWRPRRRVAADGQQFCAAVYAELNAGASLRNALADASLHTGGTDLHPIRRAALGGASIEQLAGAVAQLSGIGRAAGAAVLVAAQSGGKAARVFLRLADRAAAEAQLDRDKRVLTTQARLSAAVVCGIPGLWLALGGFGRLEALVGAGGGLVAVVGLGLEALGVAMVWRLAAA